MSNSYITKNALAQAMKELMSIKDMEKINIKDITDKCGLNRKSFYYHFKDKYELVNWIFYTDFVSEINSNKAYNSWDMLEQICTYIYKNKKFYTNALSVEGQNSFSEYFTEVTESLIYAHYQDVLKDSEDRDFFVTYFADATRLAISKWLFEDNDIKPDKFIELMKKAITGIAIHLVDEI